MRTIGTPMPAKGHPGVLILRLRPTARQIEQGAEADCFSAGDEQWMTSRGTNSSIRDAREPLTQAVHPLPTSRSRSDQGRHESQGGAERRKLVIANPDSFRRQIARQALEHYAGRAWIDTARAENVRAACGLLKPRCSGGNRLRDRCQGAGDKVSPSVNSRPTATRRHLSRGDRRGKSGVLPWIHDFLGREAGGFESAGLACSIGSETHGTSR